VDVTGERDRELASGPGRFRRRSAGGRLTRDQV
jgi:hypothetical protein